MSPRKTYGHSAGAWRAATVVALFLLAVVVGIAPAVQAQSFQVIHAFTGGNDGGHPTRVVMDGGGHIYGSSMLGGNQGANCQIPGGSGCGVVFELKRSGNGWIFNPLYTFQGGADGSRPGPVVIGPDGALYGTTEAGGGCSEDQYGCGTVFRLTPPAAGCRTAICRWVKTTLYTFRGGDDGWNNGWDETGPVTFGPDGSIYGATEFGGHYNSGVVFQLARVNGSWTESVIHTFHGNYQDGDMPCDGIIFDAVGNLYGATYGGGVNYAGVVYELSPSQYGWTEIILRSFSDGTYYEPEGGLFFDPAGNLYGSTSSTYNDRAGMIFQLSPANGSWTYNVIYAFNNGSSGGGPHASPTMDAQGNLYGTAWSPSEGSVFKLTPYNGTWLETDLHVFTGGDGALPISSVVMDSSGNLYGSAAYDGSYNSGVLWEITP